eukprot:6650904-Prorocentrum_lima.AAC.1
MLVDISASCWPGPNGSWGCAPASLASSASSASCALSAVSSGVPSGMASCSGEDADRCPGRVSQARDR